MQPHTRAVIAASAHAIITGRKVAGIHDHETGQDLRIAAECRGNRVQAVDGDRSARYGGTLPELYDEAAKAFITLETEGATARGFDRGSEGFYEAQVTDRVVQLYDHSQGRWFAFDVQLAEDASPGV